jgi:flagellar basal body rod protein FlgG
MDVGLYIAATGMLAQQVRQDQLTNDLANASTPGYKPDRSVQSSAPIRVSANGTVPASALGVFNVPNAAKQGDNLFTGAAAGRGTGAVQQGVLEGSGADPVHTMVDMIAAMREYEAGQKAIQSIDETLGESAASVGSLGGNG